MTDPDYQTVLFALLAQLAWTEEAPRAIPNTDMRADQRVMQHLEMIRGGAAQSGNDALRAAAEEAIKHLSLQQVRRETDHLSRKRP